MSSIVNSPTIYPVDPEHGRLRFAVFVLFFVAWFISFIILSVVIKSEGLNILAILLSLAIAYGLVYLIDKQLKQRWPSGRTVSVDHTSVTLAKNGQTEQEMRADQVVNPMYWRFVVRKRSRVPKGWLMCACALEYEERHLTVYTFMSPDAFKTYSREAWFTLLEGKKDTDGRTDLRLAGEQRRLREAENYRWMNGAEMSPDDFQRYVEQISTQFPEWTPLR